MLLFLTVKLAIRIIRRGDIIEIKLEREGVRKIMWSLWYEWFLLFRFEMFCYVLFLLQFSVRFEQFLLIDLNIYRFVHLHSIIYYLLHFSISWNYYFGNKCSRVFKVQPNSQCDICIWWYQTGWQKNGFFVGARKLNWKFRVKTFTCFCCLTTTRQPNPPTPSTCSYLTFKNSRFPVVRDCNKEY